MNLHRLMQMHASGEKISMLTAYDATFAALADRAGVDSLLVGLTPQTVFALGGYKVQGRDEQAALTLLNHATQLEQAGASMLVLEMVPVDLAQKVTSKLSKCATIGIGAGNVTSGQVLVMHDMLGAGIGKLPKFVRNFLIDQPGVEQAMRAYVTAVKDGTFPDNERHAW